MSTITLPNIRVSSDLTVGVVLKDGGVAIDWSTLSNIKAYLYADAQRAMAGRCSVSVDEEDATRLVCSYRANKPQYIGVNRIVITCTYRGETKTFDKPALNFVRWTDDQAGQQITIDDPDVDVEIEVEDVSSSILEQAIAAALQAAADAEHAAHLIPNQVLLDCEQATAGANAAAEAANAAGITSVNVSVQDNEPGTPSAECFLANKVLSVIFHYLKGETGDAAGFGTITASFVEDGGDPSVLVTTSGPDTAKNIAFTLKNFKGDKGDKGDQGNTGSSVDYPYELVNNCTTDDATKGLSAAQGKALKDELSQLDLKVDELLLNDITGTPITGSGINISGVITSVTGGQRTDYIDLAGMTYIYVTNPNNAKLEYDVFYDSSKAFISGSRFEVPANTAFHRVAVPSTAKYCIVSVRNNGTMPTVYGESIVPDLKNAQKDISALQSNVTKCVRFDSQSLSTSEKTQARTNIGAASATAEENIAGFVSGNSINEGSINSINTPGGYLIGASVTDCPGAAGGCLFVVAGNSRFIQKYFFHTSGLKLYYGVLDKNTSTMLVAWQEINKSPLNATGTSTTDSISQKAATDYVDNPNRPTITNDSVNSANKAGGYWVGANVTDIPEDAQGALVVTPVFNNGRWVHKKFVVQSTGNVWEQIFDTAIPATPWMPWLLTNPRAQIATFAKNIVCFGDSIFGNYDGENPTSGGVSYFLGRYGYAKSSKNVAFGGTTAALRNITYWDDMALVSLIDAIISGDWSAQDYAIAHSTEFPDAFATHLATLKAVDWANTDIVTISIGGNDFYFNVPLGDKTASKTTFTGALVYFISHLLEQYPHLQVVLLTPTWRWYKDADGYYDHDSDTEENSLNLKVPDYAQASLETSKVLHIFGCDDYNIGINKYNYTQYFKTGANADGAHHAIEGRKKIAHRIVAFLNANL